ncbi:O-6-alkylguanine-DNA alkyltransferase isoform X2 [Leptinotarsa decemlineata]|uniref:O-6-alkylguanine-DNA alkyltransferase isoform X2 n=1 Tax=Leptinotarsa decemlineata TaxID=7539 RepID=UPI000C25254E|nr:uncharacterized protein LOC111504201 [Leptinotarsa decemlineata]
MSLKCTISKLSPEDYKQCEDFTVIYGTVNTKFGKCLMGMHEDQICFLSFIDDSGSMNSNGLCTSELLKLFPKASLYENNGKILGKAQEIFDQNAQGEVKVLLKGSAFQIRIWEQLVKLKRGSTTTYEDIAKAIGHPKAVRCVASAIAKNNISYLVPCHRVISKNGTLNKYKWGTERKLNMLRAEKMVAKQELINRFFKTGQEKQKNK